MLLGAVFQRIEPAPLAEAGQGRAVALARFAGGIEGEMQDAARRLDRRERPRMHLAQHGGAQGVRVEPFAVAKRNFGSHAVSLPFNTESSNMDYLPPRLRPSLTAHTLMVAAQAQQYAQNDHYNE